MKRYFYQNVQEKLIMRDFLAIDRTILANERTLLAYVSLALTLIISGISFLEFFDKATAHLLAYIFLPSSLFVLAIGIRKYLRMRKALYRILKSRNIPTDELREMD
ncbi:MAG: DUF202 domain-containing protein [Bacteroidia bacterium]